jgi:protein-S-isoprenylcysteine O-methyltransferase Ste14
MVNFNLNNKVTIFIKIVLLFAILFLASVLFKDYLPNIVSVLTILFFLGTIAILLILIIFEAINDRFRFSFWNKIRTTKRLLSNGKYECQFCGNRNLSKNDRYCFVCGHKYLSQ